MQKFIYKSVIIEVQTGMFGTNTTNFSIIIDQRLDDMASLGWELDSTNPLMVAGGTTHYVFIFKRAVVSASELDR